MHGLRSFEYMNKCEFGDNIQDKDMIGRIKVKIFFVIQEEVIDVFHENFTFPQ